jgi:murein DD-endopeptidase MepM/ murein hydrolase activator NlpD
MRRRVIITFARENSDSALRFRIEMRLLAALIVLLVGSPALFVVGASWGAKTLISDLARQNASLKMENANYREATTQLVTQVATLQAAADDLGARASVDPKAARAMDGLPVSITHRAMGGNSSVADVTSPVTTVASSAEPAFGLLRDVLHIVEHKLDEVRPGVQRREALANATPSIWPVTGWLSSTFGMRLDPFTGARDFHEGLDISADAGQPVLATADGTVVTAQRSGEFGNLVVLDHGFGIGSRYGHLSRFGVTEGQRVRKGQVVGYVGSTGRSTSPHLHYELLLNGRPANPLRLLGR